MASCTWTIVPDLSITSFRTLFTDSTRWLETVPSVSSPGCTYEAHRSTSLLHAPGTEKQEGTTKQRGQRREKM